MLKIIPLMTAAVLALSLPLIAQDTGPVLRVADAEDQIVRGPGQDPSHHRHRVYRRSESILDFVVGDSEYWHSDRRGQSRLS